MSTDTRPLLAPTPLSPPVQRRLWFAQLGGGIAWTLHLLGSYLIAEFGCVSGLDRHTWLGIVLPAWLLIVWSLLTWLIAAASLGAARRLSRDAQQDPRALLRTGARIGTWLGGLFTAIVAVESLPIVFFLGGC